MANEDSNAVGALVGCIAELRAHCPWMGALTHESLVEYLLEEAYEVAETIETDGGDAELKAELGDVLLQVVLHARLAAGTQLLRPGRRRPRPHRQNDPAQPACVPS